MPFLKKTLGRTGSFSTAFLSAILAERIGAAAEESHSAMIHTAGPVMIVLSHLLTHISSEFIGRSVIRSLNRSSTSPPMN